MATCSRRGFDARTKELKRRTVSSALVLARGIFFWFTSTLHMIDRPDIPAFPAGTR